MIEGRITEQSDSLYENLHLHSWEVKPEREIWLYDASQTSKNIINAHQNSKDRKFIRMLCMHEM